MPIDPNLSSKVPSLCSRLQQNHFYMLYLDSLCLIPLLSSREHMPVRLLSTCPMPAVSPSLQPEMTSSSRAGRHCLGAVGLVCRTAQSLATPHISLCWNVIFSFRCSLIFYLKFQLMPPAAIPILLHAHQHIWPEFILHCLSALPPGTGSPTRAGTSVCVFIAKSSAASTAHGMWWPLYKLSE